MPEQPTYRVIVVGAGFGGLGMAMALKRAGIHDFLVVDKAADLGGIWRDNTYPGAACDVPSSLYSFSFQPGRWSRRFPPQPEILAYLHALADEHGLGPHLRLRTGVEAAEFDERRARWNVTLDNGETLRATAVVSAVGQLNRPALPDIPGRADFAGPSWHSARWDHDVDLTGRRVAVVGTGASAIQFVPEIARTAARVDIYQRTPPYILPKPDRPHGAARPGRPPPRAAQGRAAAHLPVRRAAHHRLRAVAQVPGRAHADVAPPARGADHRPGAAPQVRARLRDGLQAGAVLQRLVSDAGAVQRRAGHRPDRADRGRRGGHGRRRHPARRRDRLRHRVPDPGLPGPDGGDRPGRALAARAVARRGAGLPGDQRRGVPELLHALRAPHQPRRQLHHLHAGGPDPLRARRAAGPGPGGPGLAGRAARGAARRSTPGSTRPAAPQCGRAAAGAGTRRPTAATPTTGPTTRSCTATGSATSTWPSTGSCPAARPRPRPPRARHEAPRAAPAAAGRAAERAAAQPPRPHPGRALGRAAPPAGPGHGQLAAAPRDHASSRSRSTGCPPRW